MTVDLKWGLPLVLPFALWIFARVFWWFAGADWNDPNGAAMASLIIGVLGASSVLYLVEFNWPVTISKPRVERK